MFLARSVWKVAVLETQTVETTLSVIRNKENKDQKRGTRVQKKRKEIKENANEKKKNRRLVFEMLFL